MKAEHEGINKESSQHLNSSASLRNQSEDTCGGT
jgi:hypothetical protein